MLKKFQVELQDEEIVKFVEFACPYACLILHRVKRPNQRIKKFYRIFKIKWLSSQFVWINMGFLINAAENFLPRYVPSIRNCTTFTYKQILFLELLKLHGRWDESPSGYIDITKSALDCGQSTWFLMFYLLS